MAEAGKSTSWTKRLAIIAGWAVALLVTLTLALVGVGAVLLSGQTGRDIVENLLDGRQIAGYGELQVSGLSGNPLDRLAIEELTLADADGVWLSAHDIVFDWRPHALLNRHIDIETLSVERAEMTRRPERAEREPGAGPPRLRISVADLEMGEFHVAEGVAGQPATLTAQGALARVQGVWQTRLEIARTGQGGDRVSLLGSFGERIVLDASLVAPAGGPLASLLRAPETRLEGHLEMEGTRSRGQGGIEVTAGGEQTLIAALNWGEGEATLEGEARPGAWPGLSRLQNLLGGPSEFAARVTLEEDSLFQPSLQGGRLQWIAPNLDFGLVHASGERWGLDIREAAGLVRVLTRERVQAQSLSAEGVLVWAETRRFEGEIAARGLDLGFARFAQAEGPLVLTGPLSRPEIETELDTEGAAFVRERLDRVLGDSPALRADMIYSRETGDLSFESLTVTGAAGRAEGSGLLDPRTGRFTLQLDQSDIALGELREDMGGRLHAQGSASGNWRGPLDFDVQLEGSDLSGQAEAVLGERLQASARGQWRGGRDIAVRTLQVSAPKLRLDVTGDYGAQGWSAEGEAVWGGAVPVAAVRMEGEAAFVFDARYLAGRLDARAQVETGALAAGPVALVDPTLRLEAEGALDDLSGEWRLNAQTENGPVDLAGEFAREEDRLRLPGIDGRFGAFAVNGSLSVAPASMRADLHAEPVAGFGEFDLEGELSEGVLDVTLTGRDLVQDDLVYLDRLEARAQGRLEQVELSLNATGAYGARFDLSAPGTARLAGGPLRVELAPRGEYGDVEISTIEPLVIANRESGLYLDGTLALDGGRAAFELDREQGVRVLTLDLSDLPAKLVSYRRNRPPMAGTLSGEMRLRLAPDGWTGTADISGENLQPREDEDALALDARLDADLSRTGLQLDLTGSAPGLSLSADFALDTGPVDALSELTAPDTPIEGRARIDGEIAPVAAFQLPEGRVLEGRLDATAQVSGTIGAPDFSGEASLESGRFVDRQQGLDIRDLSARAVFEDDGLTISSIQGRGPDGGRLTGRGEISFSGAQMSGEAHFEFENLTLVDRPKLTAIGDGETDIVLEGRTITVSGETRLDEVEARPPEGGREPIASIEVTEINVPGEGEAEIVPPPQPGYTVRLDEYHIVADNRVFVRGQSFDTEWSLDVTASGRPGDVTLEGEARLIRGNASLLGQRFTFESGTVSFSGPPREAELNITAVREARDITARIRITGTAGAPRIDLTSTPSLPEDEIASRLLFGQGRGELSGVQAAQLAGALAGAAGGFDPFGALRSVAGLDQLSVVRDPTGATVVSGGRYLSDDVYLELAATEGGAAPTTRIEWFLTRRFTVESTLGGSGQSGIALSWRRDYDDLDDLGWW